MRRMAKKDITFILLLAFLGILVGIQFKSQYAERAEGSFMDRQLTSQVNEQRQKNSKLQEEIKVLRKQVERLEKEKAFENKDLEEIRQQIIKTKDALGYSSVYGDGVSLVIDSKTNDNIANLVEENKLLLIVLNELKLNGAEAYSLNGQRIGVNSEITLAGNHININSVPVAPPYKFMIIGQARRLLKGLSSENVVLENMNQAYGLDIKVKSEKNIILPRVEREMRLQNMESLEEDEI